MKKINCLVLSLAAIFAVSCEKAPENVPTASLSVDPSSLTFESVSAPAQTVTVTAANVEWELQISEGVAEWLHVDRSAPGANTLTVTVSDNPRPEKRTGSFTIKPVGNDDVKAKSVSVVQEAAEVEYKLVVEPAALTFEAENAPAQEVTVTAEGGLTWKIEVEGDASSWITATPKEGKIDVKVSDNPETKERFGNIIVVPSEESVGKKAIRVTQKELVLPPSLSIDVDDPEAGLSFHRNGMANGADKINVTAVNVNWNATAVDADNNPVTWFEVMVNKKDGLSSIGLQVFPNPEFNERVGYVVITTDNPDIPGFKVKITQAAAEEYHSKLTGDVDVSGMAHAYMWVSPNNDWEDPELSSGWSIRFWEAGVEHDTDAYSYKGTGAYMEVEFTAAYTVFNDEQKYVLPEGEYTVAPGMDGRRLPPMHIEAGRPGFFEWQQFASWYKSIENDTETVRGPINEGTVTVEKAGEDRYTFTFDCVDDIGYKITGTFTVDLPYKQNGMPSNPMPGGGVEPSALR